MLNWEVVLWTRRVDVRTNNIIIFDQSHSYVFHPNLNLVELIFIRSRLLIEHAKIGCWMCRWVGVTDIGTHFRNLCITIPSYSYLLKKVWVYVCVFVKWKIEKFEKSHFSFWMLRVGCVTKCDDDEVTTKADRWLMTFHLRNRYAF